MDRDAPTEGVTEHMPPLIGISRLCEMVDEFANVAGVTPRGVVAVARRR